jgi:6,7-dimethyl-8-ribityllumazine synthase
METHQGQLSAAGMRIAIVASRFNATIVDLLVAGALDAITRTGGREDDVALYRAPGAFELPQLARRVVARGGIDAVICLGAVIRGATPHFEHVAGAAARGIADVAAGATIPVVFGVLTTDTIEQAMERAGIKAGNKGFDAALAAIELASLFRELDQGPAGARRRGARPRR